MLKLRYSPFRIFPSSQTTIEAPVSPPWKWEMSKPSIRRGAPPSPRWRSRRGGPGRACVVGRGHGLPHLALQVRGERGGPAGREEPRPVERRGGGLGRRQAGDAGPQAAVHVVVEAGARQVAVDLQLAGPRREELLDELDRLPRQAARQVRPEVVGAVLADAAGEGTPRGGVGGEPE